MRELSVAEQRYRAVLAVIEDGVPITAVAEETGVRRQTAHTWLSHYADGGLEGLADRLHRPRSCPHPCGVFHSGSPRSFKRTATKS